MKKFLDWIKSPASDFTFFIVLLILANIVGQNTFRRFDVTKSKSYSISKPSKQLVKTLSEPLSVKVFFDDNLPSPYNSNAQYIKDLLVEYELSANKNFSVAFLDMKKEENIELARDYGLSQIQIQEIKNNEIGFKQAFMGIVISYGDKIEKFDGITSTDGLEYELTTKMSEMITTVDMLSGLGSGNKIKLTLYLSPALKSFRISGMDQVEDYVRVAYEKINKQNLDRIEFEVAEPASGEVIELAEMYGIQSVNYQNGNGQTEYAAFGLVLSHGENFRVLPVSIERSIFGYMVNGFETVEDGVASGIQSLLSKATTIGYVVGHNEHGIEDERDAKNFKTMLSDYGNYELEFLDLTEGPIPANMTTIIINGPQMDMSEEELYSIDQFVMRGGNVLFFIDGTIAQGTNQYSVAYYPLPVNIDRLIEAYGVQRNMNMVMDQNCHVQGSQTYGKVEFNWVPSIDSKDLAKNHPITNNLGYVYMLQNAALDASAAQENKDVQVTILAKSSPKSWTMEEDIVLNPLGISAPAESEMKSYDLAVLLEGKFKSAFEEAPEHKIYDEDGNEVDVDTSEDEISAASHIKSSRLPGKVFVLGSSQVTTYQLLNGNISEPISMFLLNTIDYMSGNEDLCEMRTKGLSLNTLNIESQGLANFFKYFGEFGLVILVVLAGFIVWQLRTRRRVEIRKRYNPNDTREIVKDKKEIEGGNE